MYLSAASLALLSILLLAADASAASSALDHERETVLTILHTNDLHGRILATDELTDEGPGGLARIATLMAPVRAGMPNVLVLDAGDLVHNTPAEAITRGDSMMRAMNSVGYDAATLGNHEFGWGQDITARNVATANFPFLSANALDIHTGRPFGGARDYIILNRAGIRIAIFGLTSVETVRIEAPEFIDRVRFADPIEVAKRLVPELRRKADIVIGLTHIGLKLDKELAEQAPGIDVIIGGHSHTLIPDHIWVGDTVIAQTGDWGKNLGRMDLLLRRESGRWRIASVNGKDGRWWSDLPNPPLGKSYPRQVLIPADEAVPRNPAVVESYRAVWEETDKWLGTVVAEAPEAIAGFDKDATPKDQRQIHDVFPLSLLMADLLRDQLHADVGITSAGFGPGIPAGPVTVRNIHEVIRGYSNQNILKVRVSGVQLREAIRYSYQELPNYTAAFAGVTGRVAAVEGSWRVESLVVGGAALRDDASYVVVAPSFIIRDHPALKAGELLSDRVGWQKPIIAESMARRGRLAAPGPALEIPSRAVRAAARKGN